MARVLKPEDLSMTQYNVLRILRGSPEGLASGEIGNRLITRDPDIRDTTIYLHLTRKTTDATRSPLDLLDLSHLPPCGPEVPPCQPS